MVKYPLAQDEVKRVLSEGHSENVALHNVGILETRGILKGVQGAVRELHADNT
jgi:hypothetical protein